jgi:hypothetical protein
MLVDMEVTAERLDETGVTHSPQRREPEKMGTDVRDQRREIVAFYEELVRDLDRRLGRIERSRHETYRSVPAWQHLTQRREYFLRLRAEA